MVVGSGLVARAFASFRDDPRVMIFASGVSNSTTAAPADYRREHLLLKERAAEAAHLVYFSTCSLSDPTLKGSAYIRHKQAMEEMVAGMGRPYTIFRLPNLIGHTPNPHTLCNYLRDHIMAGEPISLQTKACRYLMDVDAVSEACSHMIRRGAFTGQTINICFDPPAPLPGLLREMERVLGRQAAVREEDRGSCYAVDNTPFKQYWTAVMGRPWPGADQWKQVVAKYYRAPPSAT